jgi:hypothetical protein
MAVRAAELGKTPGSARPYRDTIRDQVKLLPDRRHGCSQQPVAGRQLAAMA